VKIKIFIIVAFLLFFAGNFSACKEKPKDNEQVECGKIVINENEFITMQVEPKKISTNTSSILKIENHTKEDFFYGSSFSLEYFNKNNWKKIRLDINWTDIGYILFAGETIERRINLYSLVEEYNNGKKGKYRIIKDGLCAEFEIK